MERLLKKKLSIQLQVLFNFKAGDKMNALFENFLQWLFERVFGFLFYLVILFVGVPLTLPTINKYLIVEIAKEIKRRHKITKIRADRDYRYLMGYSH